MSWDVALNEQQQSSGRHAGDRYTRRGEDLIIEVALAAIEKHKALPAGQAESFASRLKVGIYKLTLAQDKLLASLSTLLLTLPGPLVEPNVRQFPSNRKEL